MPDKFKLVDNTQEGLEEIHKNTEDALKEINEDIEDGELLEDVIEKYLKDLE